jgi:hypothetical protein
MQIVYKKEIADQLKSKYTVLELETFEVEVSPGNFQTLEAHCVVPSDKIPLTEMPSLEAYKALHSEFVTALNEKKYDLVQDLSTHLMGKFGGEVDSFYQTILDRIKNTT